VHGVADAAGRFPVRVAAVRYHAHPPVCAPSLVTGPSANENDFDPFIGCSDLANLALQVNDPKDLLGNRARPPADGERAAIPVARYRAFGTGGTGGSGTSGAGTGATSAP
jgi:pilus assembly protein CpaD